MDCIMSEVCSVHTVDVFGCAVKTAPPLHQISVLVNVQDTDCFKVLGSRNDSNGSERWRIKG